MIFLQKPIIFAYERHTEKDDVTRLYGLLICRKGRRSAEIALSDAVSEKHALPYLVFTPNLEMLARAKHDASVRALLRHADLLLPDGIGVILLSHFRVKERVAGIEIGEYLLTRSAENGYRVFLLGGQEGVADAATEKLRARFPTLSVVGTHHGYFDRDEEKAIVDAIRAASTDILLVCMGFPRQESFLVRNRAGLSGVRVALGLGGSLDVWSGRVPRAPAWIQGCGLEWLYRVCRTPNRFPRLLRSAWDIIR